MIGFNIPKYTGSKIQKEGSSPQIPQWIDAVQESFMKLKYEVFSETEKITTNAVLDVINFLNLMLDIARDFGEYLAKYFISNFIHDLTKEEEIYNLFKMTDKATEVHNIYRYIFNIVHETIPNLNTIAKDNDAFVKSTEYIRLAKLIELLCAYKDQPKSQIIIIVKQRLNILIINKILEKCAQIRSWANIYQYMCGSKKKANKILSWFEGIGKLKMNPTENNESIEKFCNGKHAILIRCDIQIQTDFEKFRNIELIVKFGDGLHFCNENETNAIAKRVVKI